MAGYDPRDSASIEAPLGNYLEALQQQVRGCASGVPRSPYFDRLQPDIEAAMAEALRVLEELTGSIRDMTLPAAGDFVPLLAESYACTSPT